MSNKKIQADKFRWGGARLIPQYHIIVIKRKCEVWREKSKLIFLLYRLYYQYLQRKLGVDIPASVILGEGFKIEHLGGIVINPDVKIGSNCNIYNGVTIGKEKRGKRIGNPTIGNKVWIGANSVVVGGIHIGNNVMIAPGAFVNFDVPDNSIVIGNPAKIIYSRKATESYITNIWK